MTIFDIAKILGIDEKYQEQLKKEFAGYDEAMKSELTDTLWTLFFEFHGALTDLEYKKLLKEIEDGKRELKNDLYLEAKKRAMSVIEDIRAGKMHENKQLDEIRSKLTSFTDFKGQLN